MNFIHKDKFVIFRCGARANDALCGNPRSTRGLCTNRPGTAPVYFGLGASSPTSSIQKLASKPMVNGFAYLYQTKRDLSHYTSSAICNSISSTLVRDIKKGYFTPCLGLTTNLIFKHLPTNVANSKDHLDEEHMRLQPIKPSLIPKTINTSPLPSSSSSTNINDDIKPKQDVNNKLSRDIMCNMIETHDMVSKSYADQTGRFPIWSPQGQTYIFVFIIMIQIIYILPPSRAVK